MKVYVDDFATSSKDSGFVLELDYIPRIGEVLDIHYSLMNPRFFGKKGDPICDKNRRTITGYDVFDEIYVRCMVIEVYYSVHTYGNSVTIGIESLEANMKRNKK